MPGILTHPRSSHGAVSITKCGPDPKLTSHGRDETTARALIKDHFDASTDDIARASEIYADDAVLEFPQGKERIRGKANIIAFRSAYPARVTFQMHRTIGRQDLWVNEHTIYDVGLGAAARAGRPLEQPSS